MQGSREKNKKIVLMKIGLIDVDGKKPNLALMKLSAWHKAHGDSVEWYNPLFNGFDCVYASRVFTYTRDYEYYPKGVVRGGTGYIENGNTLPEDVEHTCPDYQLYGGQEAYSMGFLTRGCIRNCDGCFVPTKEGKIRANAELDEFVRHRDVVLLDNNILAHKHGLRQLESAAQRNLGIDVNQGLDARLIDKPMAKLLAKVKWLKPVRLACDSKDMTGEVKKAVTLMRVAGVTPKKYSCYVLVRDVEDAHERVEFLRGLGVDPFAQPFRDKKGTEPTKEQKNFARWVNHKATWKSVAWKNYK